MQKPERENLPVYEDADCVDCASIDSFPASDPPGWVCTSAHASQATVEDAAAKVNRSNKRSSQ
jgi:hypothetical protein